MTTAIAQFMRELEGARAEMPAIAVVGFERTRIRSLRVLWDHATLVGQLGLPAEVTGRAASGLAR